MSTPALATTAGLLALTGLGVAAYARRQTAPVPLYLDAQATTPMHPAVLEAVEAAHRNLWANPGSPHAPGQAAAEAVSKARVHIARLFDPPEPLRFPRQVVFTSGATEALNLALTGSIYHLRLSSPQAAPLHVLTTPIEHKAVLQPLEHLQERGLVELELLPLTPEGLLLPEALAKALRPDTALVAIGWANNEIGTIQPLAQLAAVLQDHPARLIIDATQLAAFAPALPERVDAAAISAHKLYGPKGIGALLTRANLPLEPLTFGGGQEGGLRPGTLPTPLIVGFGLAARLARTHGAARAARLRTRAARLFHALRPHLARFNGPLDFAATGSRPSPLVARLPGNLSLTLKSLTAAELRRRVPHLAFSQGSACSCASRGSHVLTHLGLTPAEQQRTVRLGLHELLTSEDVTRAIDDLTRAFQELTP